MIAVSPAAVGAQSRRLVSSTFVRGAEVWLGRIDETLCLASFVGNGLGVGEEVSTALVQVVECCGEHSAGPSSEDFLYGSARESDTGYMLRGCEM